MNTTKRAVKPKWILLDADGVLQAPERPFVAALDQVAGETAGAWLWLTPSAGTVRSSPGNEKRYPHWRTSCAPSMPKLIIDRIAGTVLIGFGARLALEHH